MKTLLSVFIAIVLWFLCVPANGSTWSPDVEWVINVEEGIVPWEFHVKSEHFNVKWDGDCPMLFERVVAYETVIHYALDERLVATPEPGTWLLLSSGLGLLITRRKWNS